MTGRSVFAALALALATAGCSGATSTPTAAPVPESATLAPATRPPSTPPPAEVGPPTATAVRPTVTKLPQPELSLVPVADDTRLPAAEPHEATPWEKIGPGWVLATIMAHHSDPGSVVPYGIYLIAPDNTHYAIGTAGGYGWSFRLQAWSPDGVSFLANVFSESDQAEHLWLGNLVTRRLTLARPSEPNSSAGGRFFGKDHVVLTADEEDHSTIELIRLRDERRTVVIDEVAIPAPPDEPASLYYGPSWLAMGPQLLTADRTGVQLRDLDGAVITILDSPAAACTAVRAWDEATALLNCADSDGVADPEFAVWGYSASRSLWLVPIDRSPASKLAGPGRYGDALAIGAAVVLTHGGCCECGGALEFRGGDSSWNPPQYEPCSPKLITIRNGRFLVQDLFTDDERHVQALFEIDPDGTVHSPITAITGPNGGVMTVLPFPSW